MSGENVLTVVATESLESDSQVSNGSETDLEHEVLGMNEEDLDTLEKGTQTLLKEGALTEKQAAEDLSQIAKTRQSFRNFSPEKKKKIINKRVDYGQSMFESSLPGDVAQILDLKLENGALKNRFCQFVPFFDRAEVNLQIFGEKCLGKKNRDDRLASLKTLAQQFFNDARKACKEAEMLVEEHKQRKDNEEEVYFTPSIPTPALKTVIHIHSVASMTHVRAYQELDKLLILVEWLKWNDCITTAEQKAFLKPILDQALTLGRRGYFTFTELMRLRADAMREAKTVDLSAA